MSLVSLEEAIAAVLARARPLPGRARVGSPLPRAACSRRPRRLRSTCRRSRPRRWTATRYEPRRRPGPSPWTSGSPPAPRRRARSSPARRWRSPPAAPFPKGADAVVPIEHVEERDGTLTVPAAVQAGANVRPRGGDIVEGSEIVPAGTRIGPAQIGALAAAGVSEVSCSRRPARRGRDDGLRASSSRDRRWARARSTSRTAPCSSTQLAAAGAEVGPAVSVADDDEAHRRGDRAGPRARRARHVGRRLRRPARPRAARRGGARSRGAVLGRRRQAWQARLVRRSRRHARLRPAGQSRLVARGLRAVRAPGGGCAAGRRPIRARASSGDVLRALSGVTRIETCFFGPLRRRPENGVELAPVSGQDSHMIARAAGANALALARRGEGLCPAGSRVEYLRL